MEPSDLATNSCQNLRQTHDTTCDLDAGQRMVEWQSNPDVQRLMRRDIKRGLRPSGNYTEGQLDELANQIVELAQRRGG